MIRHEIIIRIKRQIVEERLDETTRQVVTLLSQVPGVQKILYGRNHDSNYRHAMIVITVQDEHALRRYSTHPLHERAVRLTNTIADGIAVADFLAPV